MTGALRVTTGCRMSHHSRSVSTPAGVFGGRRSTGACMALHGDEIKEGERKKKSADTAGCAAAAVNQRRPQSGALPRRTTPPLPPWNTTPHNLELFFLSFFVVHILTPHNRQSVHGRCGRLHVEARVMAGNGVVV